MLVFISVDAPHGTSLLYIYIYMLEHQQCPMTWPPNCILSPSWPLMFSQAEGIWNKNNLFSSSNFIFEDLIVFTFWFLIQNIFKQAYHMLNLLRMKFWIFEGFKGHINKIVKNSWVSPLRNGGCVTQNNFQQICNSCTSF
jgi:hypothetical protein